MVDIIVLVKQMPDLELIKPDPSTGEPMVRNVQLRMETLRCGYGGMKRKLILEIK